jgi:N-acyl-L-homoserine lactone synthetase
MVTLINRHNAATHKPVLRDMHAARKQVFVDLLGWQVPHDGTEERDGFDNDDAVYLVVRDPHSGDHLASARLLPTDRPHILSELFPELCEGPLPHGPDVREITRFCLAPGIGRQARRDARSQLVRAFVEYALLSGIRAYTGVAHLAWFSQILAAGWDVRPLGLPRTIRGQLLGAMEIRITGETLSQLAPDWRCDPAPLRVVEFDLPLAA